MYSTYWRTFLAAVALVDQAGLSSAARNKKASEILAQFDDTIQIFGDMIQNNIDFVDGLNIDVYSPTNRTLRVSKNMQPMTGRFVTGTNGGSYRGLTAYSYMLKTNDISDDVVAKVEIPYDPSRLSQFGVDSSNAFVGRMARDNHSWVLEDQVLDVNKAAFKSRISKLTSLEGEFRLVGRVGSDVGNVFMPFGTGPSTSMQVWAGGRQDVEMIDGTRFAILSDTNMTINVDIFNPVPAEVIPQGMKSLYAFGWVVNTTQPAVLNVPAVVPLSGAPAASAMPGIPGAPSAAPKASGPAGMPGVASASVAPQAMSMPPVAGQKSIVAPQASVQASGVPAVTPLAVASSQAAGAQAVGSTLLPAVVSAAPNAAGSNPSIGGTIPQTLPALGAPGLPVNANPIPLMGGGLGPWGFFGPWGGVNNAPIKGPWKRTSPKMMRRQDTPASASALPPLPTVAGASSQVAAASSIVGADLSAIVAASPSSAQAAAPAAAAATTFPAVAASEVTPGAGEPSPATPVVANSMATIAPPVASAPPAASVPSAGQPAASVPSAGQPAAPLPSAGQPAAPVPSAGQPAAPVPSAGQPAAPIPLAGQPAASASAAAIPAPPVVPQPIASESPKMNATSITAPSASAKVSGAGAQPPAVPAKTASGAPDASPSSAALPPGFVKEVTVSFPINKAVLLKLLGKMPATPMSGNGVGQIGESPEDITDDMLRGIQFQVARRDVGATNQKFTPFNPNSGNNNANGAKSAGMKLSINNGNLVLSGGEQLDGEYVVLVPTAQTTTNTPTTQALAQAQKANSADSKTIESGHLVALAIVIFAALLV